ncbi:MAG: hypothetical protein QOD53_2171 [Thermoleophilaceae bacterium]|nr:hypothetical protein [Thermoleophilaceae bacterium]
MLALLAVLATQLLLAVPALADNGEGWAGETNDKVVTFVCLGLIVGFPLFITFATLAQMKLEKRKEARKAARMRQRIGW